MYYPDPTRVGWWKNGYPDYFAKVLNAADWTPIHVSVDGEPLDLATATIHSFRRVLHLRTAELTRTFRAELPNGKVVDVEATRFVSIVRSHLGAIRYRITPVARDVTLTVSVQIDGDVVNEDSNYDEGFWDEVSRSVDGTRGIVVSRTKKTAFDCATAMAYRGPARRRAPRGRTAGRRVRAIRRIGVRHRRGGRIDDRDREVRGECHLSRDAR